MHRVLILEFRKLPLQTFTSCSLLLNQLLFLKKKHCHINPEIYPAGYCLFKMDLAKVAERK